MHNGIKRCSLDNCINLMLNLNLIVRQKIILLYMSVSMYIHVIILDKNLIWHPEIYSDVHVSAKLLANIIKKIKKEIKSIHS